VLTAVLAVVVLCGAIAGLTSFSPLAGGQPHFDQATNHFIVDHHRSITVVSRPVYERTVAAGLRLYLGGVLIFSAISAAVCSSHLRWLEQPNH
jgi:hypothetical protein